MNDIDKLIQSLVEQDSLAGQNPILTENDIQEMKMMSTVDDVQAFAITKGIDAAKVNNALINAGLEFGSGGLDDFDVAGLFGFGADALPGIIHQEILLIQIFIERVMNIISLLIYQQRTYIHYKLD